MQMTGGQARPAQLENVPFGLKIQNQQNFVEKKK